MAEEVFVDDAVGRGKEGEDVRDEVAFVVAEITPVFEVACEVDLFGGPERSLSFLVHLPYLESERGGG